MHKPRWTRLAAAVEISYLLLLPGSCEGAQRNSTTTNPLISSKTSAGRSGGGHAQCDPAGAAPHGGVLAACADEMERMGDTYSHVHLSDRMWEFEASPQFVVMRSDND